MNPDPLLDPVIDVDEGLLVSPAGCGHHSGRVCDMDNLKGLTVVIPSHNESHDILATLKYNLLDEGAEVLLPSGTVLIAHQELEPPRRTPKGRR